MSTPLKLLAAALVVALTTSCGDGGPTATEVPPPATSSATSPATSSATSGPDDDLQEQPPSGAQDLVLEDVSVTSSDGRDQVVLTFAGTGTPGWVVHHVDEAVREGSGDVVDLDGDAILRLDVWGTPTDPDQRPVTTSTGGAVVDVVASGAYEGISTVFLGLQGRTPFRVSTLTAPVRMVVDLG